MEGTERGGGKGKMARSLSGAKTQIWGQKEENGAGHGESERRGLEINTQALCCVIARSVSSVFLDNDTPFFTDRARPSMEREISAHTYLFSKLHL